MTTAGLLLAAGEGRRFGGPKALARLDGQTLVERGIGLLSTGGCDPVLVVLGAQAERVRPHCAGAQIVVAANWAEGMGASLRAGLRAVGATDAQACVVALVDQPLIGVDAVRRLLAAGAEAAVATYAGQPRNPVLFGRALWAQVASAVHGDVGARSWLGAHRDRVVAVACDDTGSPADVDTVEDLAALRASSRPLDPLEMA